MVLVDGEQVPDVPEKLSTVKLCDPDPKLLSQTTDCPWIIVTPAGLKLKLPP